MPTLQHLIETIVQKVMSGFRRDNLAELVNDEFLPFYGARKQGSLLCFAVGNDGFKLQVMTDEGTSQIRTIEIDNNMKEFFPREPVAQLQVQHIEDSDFIGYELVDEHARAWLKLGNTPTQVVFVYTPQS